MRSRREQTEQVGMLAEKVRHPIARTVTFEAPSSWTLPKAASSAGFLRFPIPGTAGAFEIRVVSAPGYRPEAFLLEHATTVRQRHNVPILDLEVDDREEPAGTRRLAVEFDVASYVWRSVLLVGGSEWVIATAIVPRASQEQHYQRFEGLVRCVAFTSAVSPAL